MLRNLPGIPPRYCDFVDTASRRLDADRLLTRGRHLAAAASAKHGTSASAAVPSLARRLGSAEAVVVFGVIEAAFLGGPLSSLLKALSVIQLAGILGRGGVAAAPAMAIAPARGPAGELHFLDTAGRPVALPAAPDGNRSADLWARMAMQLGVGEEHEVLALLVECYGKGPDHTAGTARFYEAILSPWDCPVFDLAGLPEELKSRFAPLADSAAVVVGPEEFDGAARIEDPRADATMFWPRLSATLLDSRACKTLERYGIDISDTFDGVKAMLDRLGYEGLAPAVLRQFSSIEGQFSAGISGLEQTFPRDPKVLEAIASTSRSIEYQLGRLRDRFEPAAVQRLESARRQLDRLCSLVAPGGRAQEASLAAFYFPARFSPSMVERLHTRLDVTCFEHQVINVE